ncbi:MAG: exopolysaccharide biosynthesis polyprenyl glycosylphosphotransferase [Candidatus Paceibacterota bacterium]|jgi:exopolysaccharide biosynthesis polyprenyl glycosylphosphotransferase
MKKLLIQLKMFFVFIVDLAVAFSALFFMILLRYGKNDFYSQLNNHLIPFLIIIISFILSFYIFNLYSFRFNRNITEFTNSFIKSLIISFAISILIFYAFGGLFKLTPKTNLIIFTLIFGIIDFYLRTIIKRYYIKKRINQKIFIVNKNNNELVNELKNNQNIRYEIIKETNNFNLNEIIELKPDLVIIDSIEEKEFDNIYYIIKENISVATINNFYEETFQKVPTEKIEKNEIIDYINNNNKFIFNFEKRIMDIVLSSFLIIVLSPIFIIVGLLVKLTSKGPVLIKQKRVGKNDEIFTLYKFRSMLALSKDGQAETNGAIWTENNKKDTRITTVGLFLRETHLDEIPQLINIIKGDISLVGPRPERPEFTKTLNKEILYYNLRHSTKPGLTGWAQVNYKYGASINDTKEKLKYDFYYIKNRNIFLDILIILKTIAMILQKY